MLFRERFLGADILPFVDGVLKARKCGDDSAVLNSFCTLIGDLRQ